SSNSVKPPLKRAHYTTRPFVASIESNAFPCSTRIEAEILKPRKERVFCRSAMFHTFSRQEVFDLTDTRSPSGSEFSDVGLAMEACRRADVLLPHRGHRAKLAAGKMVKKPSLPSRSSGMSHQIGLRSPASAALHARRRIAANRSLIACSGDLNFV